MTSDRARWIAAAPPVRGTQVPHGDGGGPGGIGYIAEMIASPWGGFEPGHIRFCEARLDAWIAEPGNAWSSAVYVAVGAYVALRACTRAEAKSPLLLIGATAILVGAGSFAFHATGTFFGEFADESSMFLISALMLTLALRRVLAWDYARSASAFALLATTAMLLLARVHSSGLVVFGVQIALAVALEIALWRRAAESPGTRARYGAMKLTLGTFAVGLLVWTLDLAKVTCDPTNHVLGGHAIWHALSALSLAFYHRFQEQFVGVAGLAAKLPVATSPPAASELDGVASVVESLRSIRAQLTVPASQARD
jgi:hypothetical protein